MIQVSTSNLLTQAAVCVLHFLLNKNSPLSTKRGIG